MIQTIKEENNALVQEEAEAQETFSFKSSRIASSKRLIDKKKSLGRRRSYSFFSPGSKNISVKGINTISTETLFDQNRSLEKIGGRDMTGRSLNLKPERSSMFSALPSKMG